MNGTVTLSMQEYKELEVLSKHPIIYRGGFGYYEAVTKDMVIEKLSLEIVNLQKELHDIKDRKSVV